MADDMWGDDEEEERLFAHIQETDYYNEYEIANPTSVNGDYFGQFPMDNSETDELAALLMNHQNTTELRGEISTLQRKLNDAVSLNTELKNKNYELQGEAGTLRRRLEQGARSKQKSVFERMQSMQNEKQQESEERKQLQLEIESLKSKLQLARVDVQGLEEKNRRLAKRQNLGLGNTSVSNPALSSTPSQMNRTTGGGDVSPPLSLPSKSQSTSKLGKLPFPTRNSFFAKEVRPQSSVSVLLKESKSTEVQTEETIPPLEPQPSTTSTASVGDEDEEMIYTNQPISTPLLYADMKDSTKRLIAVDLQILKPVVEKTLRYVPTAFKRRIKHRKPRFGLGLEAFDSTALMLQWMDEKEMEEFNESDDLQAEYFKRMEKIYDSTNKDKLQYPPVVDETANNSEVWPDSENLLNSSCDEDILDYDGSEEDEGTPSSNPSSSVVPVNDPRDSDTSEDEYELSPVVSQVQPSAELEVVAVGYQSQLTQTTQPVLPKRKPLTFFKEYKLKSKFLTDRNCFKYVKDGQPLEIISQILEGLFEEETGIRNTLYFVKNELRFILDGRDLFETNQFRVFMTLMVWAKNLWTVVSAAEAQERLKSSKDWNKELFGWTELILRVVWRPCRSLVEFCRELRCIFLHIMTMIIESGYFEDERENYRRLFLTVQNSIENPTHHGLLNAQLILDICANLPRSRFLPFFCRQTVPRDINLAKCFLSELSDQIHAEFKENPSVALFDRYLDVLYKLGNPSDEFTLPTRLNRKRKLGDEEAIMEEESSEESSIVQVPSNIFKSTTKCTCQVAAISNFLLILSQTFGLWRDRFREVELSVIVKQDEDEIDSKVNIYRDILVRAFEFMYTIHKHSEQIASSYNWNVHAHFWDIVASFKRFRKQFPFRPDMDAMLSHMSHDSNTEENESRCSSVKIPSSLNEEWASLVTQFPELNFGSHPLPPPAGPRLNLPLYADDDEDKEN